MKAIVGIDGSHHSYQALGLVARLLQPRTDELVLYYSIPDSDVDELQPPSHAMFQKTRQGLVKAVLGEAEAQLSEAFNKHLTLMPDSQEPRHGLVRIADQQNVDLIAIGARGLGPLKRSLLGSVSRTVVHTAGRPVLVVRPPDQKVSEEPMRVLLAWDGSEPEDAMLRLLNAFNWPVGSTGRVIRVVESMFLQPLPDWLVEESRAAEASVYAEAFVEEHDREIAQAEHESRELISRLPPLFAGSDPIIAEGHPAHEIIKAIESHNIYMVICNTRGLGAIKRLLLGSTSEYLLGHAPCSVLVMPNHEVA